MSLSDVMLQNFMPRNILESDDELDTWSGRSSSRNSSSSESGGYPTKDIRDSSDFRLFQDYFGLSNLLNNVKISEDNPLLYNTQKNLALLQRARRVSWSSDASDSAAVLSPTMDKQQYNYDRNFDAGSFPMPDAAFKQLPPPSMRLSKAMRDHIISGAYQQQISNRGISEKIMAPPVSPPSPPSPPIIQAPSPPPPQQPPHLNQSNNGPPAPPRSSTALQVCVFCRNNGESESVYTSHVLKDADGRTACPILRAYTCPICKANGDNSHTIKYCPMNQNARAGMMGQQPPPGMHMPPRNQPPHQRMPAFRPPFPGTLPHHPGQQPRLNHQPKIRL
uniref:Nanos 2 n=1 Tax=Podocoryna carnea TaxID=6096 RepID=Q670V8_PODCA|nr:nanos 2 [Podocoryna carnea]